MTGQDKKILLQDLCARLPYKVKIHTNGHNVVEPFQVVDIYEGFANGHYFSEIKPYLRPMSSMTEEEKENLQSLHNIISNENYGDGYSPSAWDAIVKWEDYCNSKHLDYRGLIEKGIALEAPKGMYKTE